MKMIIYQTDDQPVPFEESFKLLGSNSKVWFSNQKSFDFNDERENIKILLEGEEDKLVFMVPEAWKDEFHQLLTEKFPQSKWQKEQPPQKPPKEEIGGGWSEELAQFYDDQVKVTEFFCSVKNNEPRLVEQVDEGGEKDSMQKLSDTFFPIAIFIIILPVIIMFFLKPDILDVYREQMPNMLEKADQSLESNIEETAYWAKDRILKIYRQDYPNAEKNETDNKNISEAEALVEAVTEVEAAIRGPQDTPPSILDKRKLATQEVMENPLEEELYTLQIAHMSTTELEKWLEELSPEILNAVFIHKVDEEWKVTYGKFPKNSGGDILTQPIREKCCEFKEFRTNNKTIDGLLRYFPPDFPQENAERVGLVEFLNNVGANQIPKKTTGLYIPNNRFVRTCQFVDLKKDC